MKEQRYFVQGNPGTWCSTLQEAEAVAQARIRMHPLEYVNILKLVAVMKADPITVKSEKWE